ncbi:MAG: PD-(D/E)XK nuclease family protein [Nitrospirae bacterium]|nr:PD-(D/E)XK nuclease family protein [Nitrospirota bacterium]MDA1304957.1 PD-(D/E)XK nuclease family protein [Nitrospirota bacterium]
MSQPNLFSFATSELSQDAFICWLLSWAKPEFKNADNDLYCCAVRLIQALFEKHSKEVPTEFEKVEITKQDKNIDVLCVINDEYVLLIEDKTGTKNQSNQLARYLEEVRKRPYKEENILPIYFKTEDQGNYDDVKDNGYRLFHRSDFLDVLNTYPGSNSILLDYKIYLQSISNQVESYESLSIDKWEWYQWVGFYLRLQKELGSDDCNWDYVPNRSSGFLGFWWNFKGDDNCGQYLQIEEEKLCFKIYVKNPLDRGSLRAKWHEIIQLKAHKYMPMVKRPSRFGHGEVMTVCIYEGDYREHDNLVIDIGKTVQRLRNAEVLLEAAVEENT